MLPVTVMSDAANRLRNLLFGKIDDIDDVTKIMIGHPKDTFVDMDAGSVKDKNHLNLFFYNIGYDGYPADGSSQDPFYVRLYCLITAVGTRTGKPSYGEKDLRLIGEVMRVLHEHPIVSVGSGNSEIAQLQIVPHPLNLDNLNHIWSTQGDTAYRLSVAYEMALAPVPLTVAIERSPLVGETGSDVEAEMDYDLLPDNGYGIETSAPVVPKQSVNISQSDWAPQLCLVYLKTCSYSLAFKLGSTALTAFIPKIWLAANNNARIDLVWEQWKSESGWQVVSQRKNILSIAFAMHFGSTTSYVGTNGRGVFKSIDSAENWAQKNDGLSDLNVQFIAIDPVTPATLYACTNSGVFKSVDSGEHWVQKNIGLTNLNVQSLAVDPATPDILYAATNGDGIFKSVNAGDNWLQKNDGLSALNINCLEIDPSSPDSLFVGTDEGGVFKSVDAADNWEQKNLGLSNLNIQFIALDPLTATTVYVASNGGAVFKSIDSGENWIQKKAGITDPNVQFIAIDPVTTATVYIGTHAAGIFKSIDSGEHWSQQNDALSDINIQFLAIDPATPVNVYAGANGGGIFKSVDAGNSWVKQSRINIGLNEDSLIIDPDKADIAETFEESLPDKLTPGQSMLYAVRTFKSIHDGSVNKVRSNPLLVTIYEVGA